MENKTMSRQESDTFKIVCDERCMVVRRLAAMVKWWDIEHKFTFVDRDSVQPIARQLVAKLDCSPWSLLLVDDADDHWEGPEAIPMILKNLPGGKMAAVLYILPGTLWLTRTLYMLISRNHRRFVHQPSV